MQLTGTIFDYFVVFTAGVIVSFTPCVYPLIPITASFIAGADTCGTRFSGFIISVVYVFGLSLTYCSLAVFASLSGKIFGQFQNSLPVYLILSAVFLFFSLVMLDIINIPTIGLTAKNKKRPKNLWAVLLFGMTSGLIIGPCTAPILGGLLLYTSSKQNMLHSISLMFVFSFGVGFSLILVGTFSGMLSVMPKSGKWHIRIKQFCAFVLGIVSAFYLFKAVSMFIK